MKKTLELKSGYLVIEIHKPQIKWIIKARLSYVVKRAELGRFDELGMTTEDVKKILDEAERKERHG